MCVCARCVRRREMQLLIRPDLSYFPSFPGFCGTICYLQHGEVFAQMLLHSSPQDENRGEGVGYNRRFSLCRRITTGPWTSCRWSPVCELAVGHFSSCPPPTRRPFSSSASCVQRKSNVSGGGSARRARHAAPGRDVSSSYHCLAAEATSDSHQQGGGT